MNVYDFHNKQYGIKLRLKLDDNEKRFEYQCTGIKDECRKNFTYYCEKSGWGIKSVTVPFLACESKMLYLCGINRLHDNNIITISPKNYCIDNKCVLYCSTYKKLEQIFSGIVVALNELGNDIENQARLFLDM